MSKWINQGLYKLSKHIKETVDITDYLTDFEGVHLKKYGSNIRAVCPLHKDSDPSFTVNKDKGIYYCFGCKSGGSIINFVEQKHNVNRVQALRLISQNLGIKISDYIEDVPEKYITIMDCAQSFFLTKTGDKSYVDFFAKKSFSAIAPQNIGFSTTEHELKEWLIEHGYMEQDIWSFSLYGEKFNNSIVFPVRDSFGFINQFICRTFTETKYIKTDENTPIFIPHLMMGMDTLKSSDEVVVVEGCNDYYALRDKYNVVAMLGTKFTQEMIESLLAYGIQKVIFWVDGDNGGWTFIQSIYKRYADLFCKNDMQADVVFIQDKDPDDVLEYSSSKFLLSFVLDSKYNPKDNQGFIRNAVKNAGGYDSLTVAALTDYLAEKTQCPQNLIYDAFITKFSKERNVEPEAEKMLVSILLENPKSVHENQIEEEIFEISACRQIFNQIQLGQANKTILRSTLSPYAVQMMDSLPLADMTAFNDILGILNNLRDKRSIINVAKSIINNDMSVDESIQRLNDGITKFYRGGDFELVDIGTSVKEVVDKIVSGEVDSGISFGKEWANLDRILHGLCNHRLVLLSGSTGHGKTTLALNWVYNMSVLNPYKCLFFSGEMPHSEITQRLVSMGTGIPAEKIQTGQINDADMKKIYEIATRIDPRTMYINDTMDFDKIISTIRYAKIKHNINYVVIDYLQLIDPPKRYQALNRTNQLKEMSRILKTSICEELNLPVILIAQLSDQALDDVLPTARRTSESKLVQADCDVTMAMRKKTDKEMEIDPIGNTLLYVDKVRYARGGILVPVDFIGEISFMKEASRRTI